MVTGTRSSVRLGAENLNPEHFWGFLDFPYHVYRVPARMVVEKKASISRSNTSATHIQSEWS